MKKLTTLFLILVIAAGLSKQSFSATRTSIQSGNWNSSSTWQGGNIPSTGDDAVIATGTVVTVTANAGIKVLTINSGGTLNVNSGISLTPTGNLTVNGSLTILGTLLWQTTGTTFSMGVTGIINVTGILTTGRAITIAGTMNVNNGGVFNFNSTSTTVRNLLVSGNLRVGGTLNIASSPANTLTNNGNIIIYKNGLIKVPAGALTNNSGKTITIWGKLTASGTFTNSGTVAAIIIKSNADSTGSLITGSSVGGTIERYITGYGSYAAAQQADHGWHFLSTPVLNQSFSPNFAPGTNDDLYMWDEPTDYWINYKGTSWGGGTSFINGVGYLVAYQVTSARSFSGTLNGNSPVTINGLTNNGTTMHHGWNLIGNPYPSAINWKKCTRTSIDAIAKVWSETGASYIDINTAGNGDTVAIGQGFMVHVTNGQPTGNVTITLAAKTHNSPQYYKDEPADFLKLTVFDPEYLTYQESNIIFNDEATTGYDPEFDSYFMAAYAPSLYSNIGNDEFLSTNTLPLTGGKADVNIGFAKNAGTVFTLEATGIATFPEGTVITLEDKKLNVTQDLTVNPLYAFNGQEGDDPGRFVIHINSPSVGTGTITETIPYTIYSKGAEIFIQTITRPGNYNLFITDMSGRKVFTDNIMGMQNYSVQSDLQTGIYIVTLADGNRTFSKKLVITR